MSFREQTPILEVEKRIRGFDEVELGYDPERARLEAMRCARCPASRAPCGAFGCPIGTKISAFTRRIREGKLDEAAEILAEKNPLCSITSRVCPREEQCEKFCALNGLPVSLRVNTERQRGEPVAISLLERLAGDRWLESDMEIKKGPSIGKDVAVIGSGPAGLIVAFNLAKTGYDVDVFEKRRLPGGMLTYGIPPHRLPKRVVMATVEKLKRMGMRIKTSSPAPPIDQLCDEFDAVFLGAGATEPVSMDIAGEDLEGVHFALDFLADFNESYLLGKPLPSFSGKKVAAIGGGNVAVDAARVSLRLGAEEVRIIYRRSIEEMPAFRSEVGHAVEEGVKIDFLTNPTKVLGEDRVNGIECMKMKLGPPDESGRRRPIPIPGSEFKLEVDAVIEAVGQRVNAEFLDSLGVRRSEEGLIMVDELGRTSRRGLFAGGDIVNGGTTVVQAIREAEKAALGIDMYLKGLIA